MKKKTMQDIIMTYSNSGPSKAVWFYKAKDTEKGGRD